MKNCGRAYYYNNKIVLIIDIDDNFQFKWDLIDLENVYYFMELLIDDIKKWIT